MARATATVICTTHSVSPAPGFYNSPCGLYQKVPKINKPRNDLMLCDHMIHRTPHDLGVEIFAMFQNLASKNSKEKQRKKNKTKQNKTKKTWPPCFEMYV